MSDIIDRLNWRYATKEFDPEAKLSDEQVETLLEALRLSPSSFGLQPWHFVVVTDPDLRAELLDHSWGQTQVVNASHLIVLCRKADVGDDEVDTFIEATAQARGQEPEDLADFAGLCKGFLGRLDDDAKAAWMKDQVYIALGNLLTVCAAEEIDACPMEGFVPAEYDRILKLGKMGLASVVVCPVGHRSDADKYATAPKVRYSFGEVVTVL